MSKYSNNVLGCTVLVASGIGYSHQIIECAKKPWDLIALLCWPFTGYPLFQYHAWSYYLFNLLKMVSYFPGGLHGNVAAQPITLLSRYKWLNCTTDVAKLERPWYSLIMDFQLLLFCYYFFFLEGIIQNHVKNTVRSKTVVKLEFLNNAIELVWARPGDVLMCELRAIQWL